MPRWEWPVRSAESGLGALPPKAFVEHETRGPAARCSRALAEPLAVHDRAPGAYRAPSQIKEAELPMRSPADLSGRARATLHPLAADRLVTTESRRLQGVALGGGAAERTHAQILM